MKQPAVVLIGAGPGDPGLITVRGLEWLQRADVVIHDHLVSPRILEQARAGAEIINVGRISPPTMAQEAISLLVVEKARENKLVARLKIGDPFVFDRGGEEALFLREQDVPFEVVPGIPAGIAVPAYAGIPVSYPNGGDTITLVRGYEDERRSLPETDWASLAKLDGTVVCYAGAQQLPGILEALLSHGWQPQEQAVVIYDGTTPAQHTLTGSLDELLTRVRQHARREPAILVVGRVTAFREHLRWYDSRPLFGRRVLVTRPRDQAGELIERLIALGAQPIEAPMIRIAPPDDAAPLQRAAAEPGQYDWIVLTSANAVQAFMRAFLETHRDLRALHGPLLCVVGTATASALAAYGITADLVPDEFHGEAVVAALTARARVDGLRVLLPRSDIGREVIADDLRGQGAMVTEVIAYRTITEEPGREEGPDVYGMLLDGRLDVVTFTSPSAVRTFVRLYGADETVDLLKHTVVACIGPVTAAAATELGITVTVQPDAYTVPDLLDAIVAHYSVRSGFVGS